MRRHRHELSTISVSALDVFASALGVFIILASVSLPFIFNKSQSDARNLSQAEIEAEIKSAGYDGDVTKALIEKIITLRKEVEELKKLLERGLKSAQAEVGVAEALTKSIASLEQMLKSAEADLEAAIRDQNATEMIPPIDIVIALDTTGSMTSELHSLQGGIIYLARILMKWSESPAIGIVEITDECDYGFRQKYDLRKVDASSLGNLQKFVYSMGRMNTGCNDDLEEGIHLALREALVSNWRPNVENRVIILISDFPPYPNALAEVRSSLLKFSSTKEHSVSIVHPATAYTSDLDVAIMKDLARAGNGEYVDGAGSIIGAIILSL
jgi:hypothetical protein